MVRRNRLLTRHVIMKLCEKSSTWNIAGEIRTCGHTVNPPLNTHNELQYQLHYIVRSENGRGRMTMIIIIVIILITNCRASWSSGWHSCFVFGRSRLQISARRPSILTAGFVVFLSTSTRMLRQYLKIRPQQFPSESFPIHHSLITLSFKSIYSYLLQKDR
jgi:hypothetical protein